MFSIADIITATAGRLIRGPAALTVTAVSIDSRKVRPGELFIAVKGDIFDGHDFINDVVSQGVRVIVAHRRVTVNAPGVAVIRVKNTTRALGDLSRFHRLRFKVPVIALTGSAGKTTTKEMVATVLGAQYKVLKNEGTENNHIGVPLTLLRLLPSHQMAVLECGTNQPGDISWLADVARPDVTVFTNVGESHLEKLKTPLGVLKEKWTLNAHMSKAGTVIVNGDDPWLSKKARAAGKSFKVVTFGIKGKVNIRAENISALATGIIRFTVAGTPVELASCGLNNVYNALAAFVCGALFKVPKNRMAKALKKFEFPPGRGQMVRLGRGWLVNDTYNANPVSMRGALQTIDALAVVGKRILVAADMLELGSKSKILHRQMGADTAASTVDILITVGPLARLMAHSAKGHRPGMRVFPCQDVDAAEKHLTRVLTNGDAVLVKGSRRMKMEQIVDFLLASPGG